MATMWWLGEHGPTSCLACSCCPFGMALNMTLWLFFFDRPFFVDFLVFVFLRLFRWTVESVSQRTCLAQPLYHYISWNHWNSASAVSRVTANRQLFRLKFPDFLVILFRPYLTWVPINWMVLTSSGEHFIFWLSMPLNLWIFVRRLQFLSSNWQINQVPRKMCYWSWNWQFRLK